MKCIVLVVGLLAILALTRAEDDAVEVESSDAAADSESTAPAEEPQPDENEHPDPHPQHHHHGHGDGHPAGGPPRRVPVWRFNFGIDTGK